MKKEDEKGWGHKQQMIGSYCFLYLGVLGEDVSLFMFILWSFLHFLGSILHFIHHGGDGAFSMCQVAFFLLGFYRDVPRFLTGLGFTIIMI